MDFVHFSHIFAEGTVWFYSTVANLFAFLRFNRAAKRVMHQISPRYRTIRGIAPNIYQYEIPKQLEQGVSLCALEEHIRRRKWSPTITATLRSSVAICWGVKVPQSIRSSLFLLDLF